MACTFAALCLCLCLGLCACGPGGYSDDSLFPADVRTVYVQMFENDSFWRGVEYELTDALAKRIEAETPYKIVSDRDRADTLISGRILWVGQSALSIEREVGRVLEKEVEIRAVVNWKDLRTAKLMVDSRQVSAAATYTQLQSQDFNYAHRVAANNLAQKIVELMEKQW